MKKIKASHTKEKIITVFYAKQGFEEIREVCEPFSVPFFPSLRIKGSHAFVFPSKPKFGIPSS